MKDRLLYLTIGVLLGIIVMQWAMPEGQATIVTPPVGSVVAVHDDWALTANGEIWEWTNPPTNWVSRGSIEVPVSQIQFLSLDKPRRKVLVTYKDGDTWERTLAAGGTWINRGQPTIGPILWYLTAIIKRALPSLRVNLPD